LGRAGTIAPSERITLGLVGCGLHGAGWNLDQVFRCADAQVVAVCDVDDDRCQKARAKVEGHYSRQLGRGHADR
jgi:predicted dehydrogenase